jgi:hypothetical protein
MTDAGLKELAKLKQLQMLDLHFTQVTGAGLKELAELQQLQTLQLVNNRVTDAGMKGLAELNQIQTLVLEDLGLKDAGLLELTAPLEPQWTEPLLPLLRKALPGSKILHSIQTGS